MFSSNLEDVKYRVGMTPALPKLKYHVYVDVDRSIPMAVMTARQPGSSMSNAASLQVVPTSSHLVVQLTSTEANAKHVPSTTVPPTSFTQSRATPVHKAVRHA